MNINKNRTLDSGVKHRNDGETIIATQTLRRNDAVRIVGSLLFFPPGEYDPVALRVGVVADGAFFFAA